MNEATEKQRSTTIETLERIKGDILFEIASRPKFARMSDQFVHQCAEQDRRFAAISEAIETLKDAEAWDKSHLAAQPGRMGDGAFADLAAKVATGIASPDEIRALIAEALRARVARRRLRPRVRHARPRSRRRARGRRRSARRGRGSRLQGCVRG